MTFVILISIICGIGLGYWVIPDAYSIYLDSVTTYMLALLLLGVGIDLGRNREIWRSLRELGCRILLVPFGVGVGSVVGAVCGGVIVGLPINESSAVGAGFGWYSLSGVLIAQIYSAETGTLAFLTNVLRELLAFIFVPLAYRYLNKYSVIALGGATSMDTTLPLISRVAGSEMAVIAFLSGVTLTAAVPILVPLLIRL